MITAESWADALDEEMRRTGCDYDDAKGWWTAR